MKLRSVLVAASLSFVAVSGAHATALSGAMTADNAFYAYISTDPNTLGTLVGSGDNWGQSYSINGTLADGQTNYLHIEVINYGGPYALLGSLSLSDSNFSFLNGTQSLTTNTTGWTATYASANSSVAPQPWVSTSGAVVSIGQNGVGPWGYHPGIDSLAQWIDAADTLGSGNFTIDFTAEIVSNTVNSTVPEPATLALLGAGLAGLGALSRRRKAS